MKIAQSDRLYTTVSVIMCRIDNIKYSHVCDTFTKVNVHASRTS